MGITLPALAPRALLELRGLSKGGAALLQQLPRDCRTARLRHQLEQQRVGIHSELARCRQLGEADQRQKLLQGGAARVLVVYHPAAMLAYVFCFCGRQPLRADLKSTVPSTLVLLLPPSLRAAGDDPLPPSP